VQPVSKASVQTSQNSMQGLHLLRSAVSLKVPGISQKSQSVSKGPEHLSESATTSIVEPVQDQWHLGEVADVSSVPDSQVPIVLK